MSIDQIVSSAMQLILDETKVTRLGRFLVLSPLVIDRKGEFSGLFDNLKAKGFKQVRVDGVIKDLAEDFLLLKTNKHTIETVIDRLSLSQANTKDKLFLNNLKSRLTDSASQALNLSEGTIKIAKITDEGFDLPQYPKKFEDHLFSEKFACPVDNITLEEIEPRTFSFNSPHGACPTCSGLGKILKVEPDLVFSEELSIMEGGILPFSNMFEHDTWFSRVFLKVCEEAGINPRKPIKSLGKKEKDIILYGTGDRQYKVAGNNRFGHLTHIRESFPGLTRELEKKHAETESDFVRWEIEKYMRQKVCQTCNGARLKKEALSITIGGLSISEVTSFSVIKSEDWRATLLEKTVENEREKEIARLIVKEIGTRLNFLKSVGLEYLTLDREAGSLSGGEAQRIRLASQIGSGLTGVLYVLDEPTIGLHQRDNQKLIDTLKKLRDLGNTVIVVEHDAEMMRAADHLIDFGPGAGKHGGEVVAEGAPADVTKNPKSITGQFLSGKRKVVLGDYKMPNTEGKFLKIAGASQFNLKSIDVAFPLGKFIAITGVSGSGKSTLLVETLYPALSQHLNPYFRGEIGTYRQMDGAENIDKVILIDQSPIGRTPRSNPATYTGLFDPIRDVFAQVREAKAGGFKKGRFSFNVKGGRCENCEGQGQIKIEMQFMSDIWVTCEVCHGKRYNAQTLEVAFRGKNIAEVLEMTVDEALEFFHTHPQILNKLETMSWVGLGYMQLGQPATTLSGGEAQRVKLATELARKSTGKTFYILDEPTTGLHFADVEKLLRVLKMLVSKGNTVSVIEHNLDVIKNADWIIDLGPGGGEAGGEVLGEGTLKNIKGLKASYTGRYL